MENAKINLDVLNKYYEDGLLDMQTHATLPLIIWNYTRRVQYESLWDNITTMCRGLVTDVDGVIIAKPFPKFKNYEEHTPEDIPNESFDVYSKMDGSLGIVFYYNSEWMVATKGSFTSLQAVKAKQILYEKYDLNELVKSNTYLFEIIFKENKIVVDYGNDEKLVLLSAYNTSTGVELIREELESLRSFELVKKYDVVSDFRMLKNMVQSNEEGFVIRFKSGFRMKIKGEEYVRLHKIITNISSISIWEVLKDGKDIDLSMVPDEFDNWIKTIKSQLYGKFYLTKITATTLYNTHRAEVPNESRRDYAAWVQMQDRYLQSILFRMADDKTYDDIIWKQVRPEYSKPVWDGEA